MIKNTRLNLLAGSLRREYNLQVRHSSTGPVQGNKNRKAYIFGGGLLVTGLLGYYLYGYKKDSEEMQVLASKPNLDKDKVSVVFVLGGPGSGKGTQCEKLVKEKAFVHLSAGDLLRAEQKREGSQYGELIAKCIKEGIIVPQEVTVNLLRNAIQVNVDQGSSRFLIDGFPRKMDQALTFEKEIVPSSFTLFFECPEEVMLKRLLERGKTSGRTDDNIESIKKRFATFLDTSMPVVEFFEKQNKVVRVKCDKPVEVVSGEVQKALQDRHI